MRVIGTAGHVDHGKSTLVQALTGTHPDRLKEEREREMTIDLGFAWMHLAELGEDVGVVDVPGHRDFIENMLAGVGGIDAALFVVAADEGVMPQTREHLAILDILQISAGVVALTKLDMVDDPDWLELVEDDIRRSLVGTVLEKAPILRVSARKGQGIDALKSALSACLAGRPARPDLGRPRLPVDRVFSMPGFGTVVTGTLVDGRLRVGEEVEILGGLKSGLRGRVRGLQTHRKKEESAAPGSRSAVNISGLDVDDIQRGCVVAHPGDYRETRRIDVRFRLLPDVTQPLEHNTDVKLFVGAAEHAARLRLLGVEQLAPGQEAFLQLELASPGLAVRGDHYILRRPSPGETLGGGRVLDPHPQRRHKRFSPDTLSRLESLQRGTPGDVLLQAIAALGAAPLGDALARSSLSEAAAAEGLEELRAQGLLAFLEGELAPDQPLSRQALVASRAYWNALAQRALAEVQSFHAQYPLRKGMPKEELKSRLKIQPEKMAARLFTLLMKRLVEENSLQENGPLALLPGHSIVFNPQQQQRVGGLLARFAANPYSPPTSKDCIAEVGQDVYTALIDLGELTPIPPDVVFRRQDYEQMVAEIRRLIQSSGPIGAAQVRDHFQTSRRYALSLLEHLDAIGVTVREGDVRRLK